MSTHVIKIGTAFLMFLILLAFTLSLQAGHALASFGSGFLLFIIISVFIITNFYHE